MTIDAAMEEKAKLIGRERELQECLQECIRILQLLRQFEVNDRKLVLGVIKEIYQQRAKQAHE